MNHASDCHEIPDCPGIFVDAFRGAYLTHKSKHGDNVFILSHYHGDHYGSLPREGNYQGLAKIHCTSITAALLVRVHGVHPNLVVSHALGETWTVPSKNHPQQQETRITFYDANHCPGAAIILLQASNGKVHLHTGDMRYHERMQSYPLLREFALQRKVDTVLLDTTYAHPKHDFLPQEEAVDLIASTVQELLQPQQPKTLILLSCYSIGKEKVLWEVARQTGHRIYATEKKRRMLECIQMCTANNDDDDDDSCHCIIEHCTDDPTASDIHIIPMGLAGQMWPFFQPNYKACLEYMQRETKTKYERVVAFIPSGWADASNWNKKNACKTIVMENVTTSVRLVAYSEHSTFDELQQMVDFLQPRQVIPTVYSDNKDRVKIQARFRASIDSTRAKQAFFKSMTLPSSRAPRIGSETETDGRIKSRSLAENVRSLLLNSTTTPSPGQVVDLLSDPESDKDVKDADKISCKRSHSTNYEKIDSKRARKIDIECLASMGFSKEVAQHALEATGSDVSVAIDYLLKPQPSNGSKRHVTSVSKSYLRSSKESPSKTAGMQSIAKFFSVKKK